MTFNPAGSCSPSGTEMSKTERSLASGSGTDKKAAATGEGAQHAHQVGHMPSAHSRVHWTLCLAASISRSSLWASDGIPSQGFLQPKPKCEWAVTAVNAKSAWPGNAVQGMVKAQAQQRLAPLAAFR